MNSTAISSGAIVLSLVDGQLQAMAHEPEHGVRAYVIPKGHVELGESFEQTALREVEEETGLTSVQLVTYLGNIVRQSVEDNGSTVEKAIHIFLGFAEYTSALNEDAQLA